MKTPDGSAADFPSRRTLPYDVAEWVKPGSLFFITICCAEGGQNQLCKSEIAAALFESVAHRQMRQDWFARLVLLMPDHLHALIAFPADAELKRAVTQWKSYLAGQHGIRWQRDFFDHRLRSDESWEEKARYIRMNPVRAGLAEVAEQWAYVWEPA